MIKRQDLPEGFTWVEVELGDGDVLIAAGRRAGSEYDNGIMFASNPNGKRPAGEQYKELCGEAGSCISEIGAVVFFKSVEDIDLLVCDLIKLRGIMTEQGGGL